MASAAPLCRRCQTSTQAPLWSLGYRNEEFCSENVRTTTLTVIQHQRQQCNCKKGYEVMICFATNSGAYSSAALWKTSSFSCGDAQRLRLINYGNYYLIETLQVASHQCQIGSRLSGVTCVFYCEAINDLEKCQTTKAEAEHDINNQNNTQWYRVLQADLSVSGGEKWNRKKLEESGITCHKSAHKNCTLRGSI